MDLLEINDGADFEVEINDWWVIARYREIKENVALEKKAFIVDIGCGSGQNLFFIQRDYPHLRLVGVDHKAGQVSYDWLPDNINMLAGIQSEIFDADVYLLMDVLEHIENADEFLSMIVQRAKRGATFHLSVPAFPILWSLRDTAAGHYRRYTKTNVQKLCSEAGLSVDICYYKFSFLFIPLFFLKKRVRSIGVRRRWIASSTKIGIVLNALSKLEEKLPRLPFGTSIIVVGRKN